MQIKTNQIFMVLAIIGLIFQTKNLFILESVQPIGYTVDIYSMFPFTFYMGLIITYFIASFLVLNGQRFIGAFILCLNHIVILIIPYMLAYYSMGRADDMHYIGKYVQIMNSGYFGSDIYPASHIIGAGISIVSNLEPHYTSFIIPIFFSFIFIIGIYLFSRELCGSHNVLNSLLTISSFILYLGVYNFLNVPHALFFSLIPLYLCFFHRYIRTYSNTSLSIVFVIMTLLMPISHPFIIFFLFIVFFLHWVPTIITLPSMEFLQIPKIKLSSFLLLFVSFITWFIYNKTLMEFLKIQYIDFINKYTIPVLFETTGKLSEINFGLFEYIKLFSFYYGRYIIPLFIIFISQIYLYKHKYLFKIKDFKYYPYTLVFFIVLIFTQLVLLFNPIISHQPDRIMSLNFIVYAQVPLFACSLYLLFLRKSNSLSRTLLVCLICLLIWSLGLFGCFDSPKVYHTNVALTYNEVYGMKWFYESKDESIIAVPFSQINRFHSILWDNKKDDDLEEIPDHFGYLNNSNNFISNLKGYKDLYVIILTLDELLYQEVPGYKTVGRFTKTDFDKFRNDSSINKIYDSLNIEIFRSNV